MSGSAVRLKWSPVSKSSMAAPSTSARSLLVLPLLAAHRLGVHSQCERGVGVAHFRHDVWPGLPYRESSANDAPERVRGQGGSGASERSPRALFARSSAFASRRARTLPGDCKARPPDVPNTNAICPSCAVLPCARAARAQSAGRLFTFRHQRRLSRFALGSSSVTILCACGVRSQVGKCPPRVLKVATRAIY